MSTRVDSDEIGRAVGLLVAPDTVVELRAPRTRYGTQSGYFDDPIALVGAATELSGTVPGVYLTLNPVRPELLARAANRVERYAKTTTGDGDIAGRRWVPLDFDPERPAGIGSTDAGHAAALAAATTARDWLVNFGLPAGSLVLADSGNGAHVLVRIDLVNDEASTQLVRRCVEIVAFHCGAPKISIDTAVYNAARIWKVYGTLACKGDAMPNRPHRLARIVDAPSVVSVAPRTLLERLAASLPVDDESGRGNGRTSDFDVRAWLATHGLAIRREKPWGAGGAVIELHHCVFDEAHDHGEAAILVWPSGMLGYKCHHNSCRARQWRDVRERVEPGRTQAHARRAADDRERRSAPTDTADSAHCEDDCWPNPLPLDALAVPPFPVEALPRILGDRVRDVARVTQTPPDLAGTCMLVTVAAAGVRRVDVMIGTTHVEPVNLYALCVAESGTRKTPAQRAMSAPLHAVQAALQARKKPEIQQAQQRRKIAEKHIEHLSAQAAKACDPAERERLTEEAAQLASTLPPVPPLPTLVVGDRTPEKLEENLAEQGGALLIEDEEAGSLFAIAGGRYSRDGSAQLDVYLKGYDRGRLDTDRITRDPVQCLTPELSISVTPQPIVLRQLRERPEFHHRGLLPRFLFSVPASMVGHRPYDQRQAFDPAVAAAYASVVERVAGLEKRRDGDDLPHLRIERDALAVWAAYHDRVEREMRDGERLAGIREWASKQPGRVARLAGVLHLIEMVAGDSVNSVNSSCAIPPRTVETACQLGEYFEAHALAAYDVMGTLPQVEGARRVLAWIKRTVPVAFSERDAARGVGVGQGRFFSTMDELTPCLRLLVEHGYLRPARSPLRSGPGQKPSPSFEIHPGFLETCRQNRQNSPDQGAERNSVNSVNAPESSPHRRGALYPMALGANLVPVDALDEHTDDGAREVTEL